MRATRSVGLAALGVCALASCYTLQPARGVVPEAGAQVAFDLNDAGRSALGASIGPSIAQVEGRLVSKEDGDYLVAVSVVRPIQGGEQIWSGEQVRVKPDYVSTVYVRRLSTARSVALGTTTVGGFAAFLVGRALRGSGTGRDPGTDTDSASAHRGRP
jgi:hypothetical protein